MSGESELEMAERHVREGTVYVEAQKEIVRTLSKLGCETESSKTLLHTFEELLAQHKLHADRLRRPPDFARKVEEFREIIARMEAQRGMFGELIAQSQKVIDESRALLMEKN